MLGAAEVGIFWEMPMDSRVKPFSREPHSKVQPRRGVQVRQSQMRGLRCEMSSFSWFVFDFVSGGTGCRIISPVVSKNYVKLRCHRSS